MITVLFWKNTRKKLDQTRGIWICQTASWSTPVAFSTYITDNVVRVGFDSPLIRGAVSAHERLQTQCWGHLCVQSHAVKAWFLHASMVGFGGTEWTCRRGGERTQSSSSKRCVRWDRDVCVSEWRATYFIFCFCFFNFCMSRGSFSILLFMCVHWEWVLPLSVLSLAATALWAHVVNFTATIWRLKLRFPACVGSMVHMFFALSFILWLPCSMHTAMLRLFPWFWTSSPWALETVGLSLGKRDFHVYCERWSTTAKICDKKWIHETS